MGKGTWNESQRMVRGISEYTELSRERTDIALFFWGLPVHGCFVGNLKAPLEKPTGPRGF